MFHLYFHMYVANVFIWMLHMFHTYVASVLSGCCVCLQWFLSVLGIFASVSDACFKCFIYLQTYIASVLSRCFKTRLSVAHVAMWSVCCRCWRGAMGRPRRRRHLLGSGWGADAIRGRTVCEVQVRGRDASASCIRMRASIRRWPRRSPQVTIQPVTVLSRSEVVFFNVRMWRYHFLFKYQDVGQRTRKGTERYPAAYIRFCLWLGPWQSIYHLLVISSCLTC